MISLAFVQLLIIVLYHFLTYKCHCNVARVLLILKNKLNILSSKIYENNFNAELLNIPECTYNYTEFQDGLVSDDFKQNDM